MGKLSTAGEIALAYLAEPEKETFWRRREGVEPSGDLTTPRLVLKTSGTTGHLPSPDKTQLASMPVDCGKAAPNPT
jgi:hypothetical protein